MTNGKLSEAKESFTQNWYEREIEINGEDVSDIIILHPTYIQNATTRRYGKYLNDVVRPDRNFVLIHCASVDHIRGAYVKHDTENDVLIIVKTRLLPYGNEMIWAETERFFITKDQKSFGLNDFWHDDIDICGQTPVFDNDYCSVCDTDSTLVTKADFVYPYGMAEECLSFFGCLPRMYNPQKPERDWVCDFTMVDSTLNSFAKLFINKGVDNDTKYDIWLNSIMLIYGGISRLDLGKDTLPSLPDEAMHAMEEVALDYVKANECSRTNDCVNWNAVKNYSCLQRVGKTLYLRIYKAVPFIEADIDKTTVKLFEVKRIVLNKRLPRKLKGHLNSLLVWVDPQGFDGTILENVGGIVYDYMDMLAKAKENGENTYCLKACNMFYLKYGVDGMMCVILVLMLASNSTAEKIVKLIMQLREDCSEKEKENIRDTLKVFCAYLCSAEYSCTKAITDSFGDIDESEPTLNKMLGVPSGLFSYAIKANRRYAMLDFKALFDTKEARQYFVNMNNEEWMLLFELRDIAIAKCNYLGHMQNILRNLISVKGHEDWKTYTDFIMSLSKSRTDLLLYLDYTEKLKALGEAVKDAKWRLSGETLQKAYDSLCAANP